MSDAILDSLKDAEHGNTAAAKITSPAELIPYCKVPDARGEGYGMVPMKPWPHILRLLDWWSANKRTLCKKSRQMGVTWAAVLDDLYYCGWNSHRTVFYLNYNQEAAAEAIFKMKILWDSLPAELRPAAEFGTNKAVFADGSRVMALPVTDMAGAGYTPNRIRIDEAALIKDLHKTWPAVSQGCEHGSIHLFSSARKEGAFFSALVSSAKTGNGLWAYRFLHYSEHPDKDPNTEKGRKWLADRKAELSRKDFEREHEGIDERPGNCYFDDETVQAVRAGCVEPIEQLWGGRLLIYERPRPGQIYVGGSDVAEGLSEGDFSATALMNKRTGKQVAAYHGHVAVNQYAEDLVRLAKLYNRAWLAIEANNHGHAVCSWAYHHCRYRRLLRENKEGEGQLGAVRQQRLGVLTTAASKPAMLSELEHGLSKGGIQVADKSAAEELSTYLILEGGGYGAAPGAYDDRVIALMLAQYARARRIPKCA